MSEQGTLEALSASPQTAETAVAQPTPPGHSAGSSGEGAAPSADAHPRPVGQPRLRTADRQQMIPAMPLDQLIEPDHPARDVWRFVEGLDLSPLYDLIKAREHRPGRPSIDPRILAALWLYAIFYGVTSGRRLQDLVLQHNAFRWLAGGIWVNHHTLSDFFVDHLDFLEKLFEHSVQVLEQEGLVDFARIAQDGMRVRASAGAASFHRRATLQRIVEEAQAKLQKLQQQAEEPTKPAVEQVVTAEQQEPTPQPEEPTKGEQAARQRAAEECLERAEQALARLPEMEAKKDAKDKEKARVSTTDPEATVMKMADGGFRPAYNVQFGTDCESLVIVGVDVVMEGSDQHQLPPMLDQVEERFGQRPEEALVDGGFANHEDIEKVQSGEQPCKVYAPVPKPKTEGKDRYEPHSDDGEQAAEWRQRMGTDEAKEIYKERAATAELANAQARNRGMLRFLVRGLQKVKAVAFWFAIVHNMVRGFSLLPQQVLSG